MDNSICLIQNDKDLSAQGIFAKYTECGSGVTAIAVSDPYWTTNTSQIPIPAEYYMFVDEQTTVYSLWDSMLVNPYYAYESKDFELFERYEVLRNFSKTILENTQDIDPDIAKVVSDHFWELL